MAGCPFCFDLHERVVEWNLTTEEIWSGTSCNDVSASADQGCEGCILIKYILFELACVDISEYSVARIESSISVQGPAMFLVLRENGKLTFSSEFQLFPSNNRRLFDGKASKISGDTSSNEAFETARAWLENCVTNHAQCKTSDILPRRVIDVGEPDTEDLPKMIEPCETQRGKYACLSYCWGEDPEANIRTTKSTLAQRKSGIEWEDIPSTTTDAILACRKLGIRFLWIDALCIIQDDVQDWALECANMAEIYSNSYITLAAVAAHDPTCGMFKRSLVDKYRNIDFNVQIAGSNETAKISAREALSHQSETGPQSHMNFNSNLDSGNWPLMTRAWVLQEMLLSPRILRFNMHELSWECREVMTCECSRTSHKSTTSLIHKLSSHERSVSDEEYFQGWRDIILSFSGRDITYENDRLPAISAIARKLSPVGGRYFAGIWEKDLFRGLLWKSRSSQTTKRLDKSAPSWSWISSQTHVFFACDNPGSEKEDQFVLREQAKVRDIQCIPATANEFGSVLRGSITLSGRFVQVLVTCTKRTMLGPPINIIHVSLPRPFQDIDTFPGRSTPGYGLRDDNILSDPSAEMYAFLLASNTAPMELRSIHFSLILRKVPSEEYPVAYERLGLLEEYCPYDEPSAQLHGSIFAGSTEETITVI